MGRILKLIIIALIAMLISSAILQADPAGGQANQIVDLDKKVLVTLHALKTATLSAEVPGVIVKTSYEMGQKFKKNESLIELNPKLFYAEKRKAAALLKYAAVAYQTNYDLNIQKSISGVEFAKVKADLEVAKANLAISDKKLKACSVRAPYPGRVVKLLVKENEWVEQGQLLVEIVDDQTIQAKFIVLTRHYNLHF